MPARTHYKQEWPDRAWFEQKYLVEQLSSGQIARLLQDLYPNRFVDTVTVSNKIKRFGIKRSSSEAQTLRRLGETKSREAPSTENPNYSKRAKPILA